MVKILAIAAVTVLTAGCTPDTQQIDSERATLYRHNATLYNNGQFTEEQTKRYINKVADEAEVRAYGRIIKQDTGTQAEASDLGTGN